MLARPVQVAVAVAALWVGLPGLAAAVGAPAGAIVTNQASVRWVAAGAAQTGLSNPESFAVDEQLAVSVTLQSVGNVIVAPGAVGELLTFRVENTGNGREPFALAVANNLATNDFDPLLNGVFLDGDPDGNGPLLPDGAFDPADDPAYDPSSPPLLDANLAGSEAVTVFVFNDIPAAAANAELGQSELRAESVTGAGLAPGTGVPGAGDGGTTAVVGPGGPAGVAAGTYQVASTQLSTVKTGLVLGPQAVPGALIEYRLEVTASGSGTATGVTVVDPIPAGTTYVPGSIAINGVPQGDPAGDGDAGDFGATNPGAVTALLPDLTQATPPQTVTFRVTIN